MKQMAADSIGPSPDRARLRRRLREDLPCDPRRPCAAASLARDARVAVVGQGYVGLSLACAAAEAGFEVTGIDVDADRVDALAAGELVVPGVDEASFRSGVATGRLGFTAGGAALATRPTSSASACPPRSATTPPTCPMSSRRAGTWPGTWSGGGWWCWSRPPTRGRPSDLVAPLLEASGQRVGRDFLLAYSPERIDPGNAEFNFGNTPRIVGGTTAEATAVAALFYEQMIENVVTVSSAGRPSWPSCWRTPSGTSTSPWSTRWRWSATSSASTSGR